MTSKQSLKNVLEFKKDGYTISTDKARLDVAMIHDFLRTAYWAENIPVAIVRKSIENSMCFGVYHRDEQIGFARVISDCATFGYLGDVFILDAFRGGGLAKWLIECILSHPELQGLRRWILATKDARRLYEKYGFKPLNRPDTIMEIHHPNPYGATKDVGLLSGEG